MFDFDVRSGNDPLDNDWLKDLARLHATEEEFSQPLAEIPRRAPLVVAPSWTLREAFKLMVEHHAGAALVASHGVLLGMLSERQIVRQLLETQSTPGELPVWRVMAPEPETLLESDSVAYAIRKLWALGGTAMPIVRASGAVFGLLETQDLVSWMCGRVGAGPVARMGHG